METQGQHEALPTAEDTLAGTHLSGDRPIARAAEAGRGTEIGRYLVLGELGHGSMGTVYAAFDGDLDRRIALKVISEPLGADDDRRRRLLGEAQLMAKVSHPNVVTVYDVGVWDDRIYVAMELVDGTTLDRWCAAPGRTHAEVLDAFLDAARALAAAHDVGVIHRDFKPANVLISSGGRARVADFGLARTHEPLADGSTDGAGAELCGTPAYMAPEQWAMRPLDGRADQFAFGVALFEALVGKRPFEGETAAQLAVATTHGRIVTDDAKRLESPLRAVILRALSPRVEDRFPSMHELVDALGRARRRGWAGRAVIAGMMTLAVATAWAVSRTHDDGDRCDDGAPRIAGLLTPAVRESFAVDGVVTPAYAHAQRRALEDGIVRHGARWAEVHDALCRARGGVASVDPAHRSREACVENRFSAFAGIVGELSRRPVDATLVASTIESLPDVEQCTRTVVNWNPVPTDPEEARLVADLLRRLSALSMRRRAGEDGVGDELEALLREAKAIDFVTATIEIQIELAKYYAATDRRREAEVEAIDALRLAVAHGLDHQCGRVVSCILLIAETSGTSVGEARRWAALGDAFAARNGADPRLRGDIANNLGLLLLVRGDAEGALVAGREAQAAYTEYGGSDGILATRARINEVRVLALLGRADEAVALGEAVLARLDELVDPHSADNIAAVEHLAAARHALGDPRGGSAMLAEAARRQIAVTGLAGARVGRMLTNVAVAAAGVGDLDGARGALAQVRIAEPDNERSRRVIEAMIALNGGETEPALRKIEDALAVMPMDDGWRPYLVRARAAIHMSSGRPDLALAELESLCGAGAKPLPYVAASCATIGLAAAAIARDEYALKVWSARVDQAPPLDALDQTFLDAVRIAASDSRDPAEIARVREVSDDFARRQHPGYSVVRILRAWLATR